MLYKSVILGLGLLTLVACEGEGDKYFIKYPPPESVVQPPVQPVVPPVVQPIVPPDPIGLPPVIEPDPECLIQCRAELDACLNEVVEGFRVRRDACNAQFPPELFPRFREDNTECILQAELDYQRALLVCYDLHDTDCVPQCTQ